MADVARVRVFIRSYNRRDELKRAIDSVLAQTMTDIDIVVIDDASTDGSCELAQEYARRHPGRVSVLTKAANAGPLDSIDRALAMPNDSEYTAFLDDDDLWHPDKIAAQVAELDHRPDLGLVATDALVIDGTGATTGELFSDLFAVPRAEDLGPLLFDANFLCASSVLVRTDALALVRDHYTGCDGLCFDMYMWIVIAAHFGSKWLSDPLTVYRRAGSGLTAERADDMWRETHTLRRHAFDRFPRVRLQAGGVAGDHRVNGDALYRAMLNLRLHKLREYWWFSLQVLRLGSPRWAAVWAWLTVRTAVGLIMPSGSRTSGSRPAQP